MTSRHSTPLNFPDPTDVVRKPYASPRLTTYGALHQVTLNTGAGKVSDGAGKGKSGS